MTTVFARKALLEGDWAENVRLQVENGRIAMLQTNTGRDPQAPFIMASRGFAGISHSVQDS